MIRVLVKLWFTPILLVSMLFAQAAAESAAAEADMDVSKVKPERVVMVRVNGEEITVEDYVNFLQKNPTYVQASMAKDGKAKVVQVLVANALMRQRMTGDGLLSNSEKITEAKLMSAYAQLSEKHFPLPPAPADDEAVRQYYLQHQNDYGIPELARVSQIQFLVPKNATPGQKSAARKKAEAALKRLKAGEPFAKVAKALTENPAAKSRGGDLGFFPRQEVSWLQDALKDLKPGQYSRVIESPVGYEILLFTDIRPRLNSTYEDVRDKVAQRMRLEAQDKDREAYLNRLAKEAKIEIVQEELKPLFPKGIFP